jgi:hypothetical protein
MVRARTCGVVKEGPLRYVAIEGVGSREPRLLACADPMAESLENPHPARAFGSYPWAMGAGFAERAASRSRVSEPLARGRYATREANSHAPCASPRSLGAERASAPCSSSRPRSGGRVRTNAPRTDAGSEGRGDPSRRRSERTMFQSALTNLARHFPVLVRCSVRVSRRRARDLGSTTVGAGTSEHPRRAANA